jgi:hypothetical protein
MIISCSRRTDIPAFFAPWFMNRIAAGYCTVVNPMNPEQVSYVSLALEDVDAVVFWTKNPAPLLPRLRELSERGYCYYFQYTLTGYGTTLEPGVPSLPRSVETFHQLGRMVGPQRVVWRYDPIVVGPATSFAYHLERFRHIASLLRGSTTRVVISILDLYKKTARNLRGVVDLEGHPEALPEFGSVIRALASVAGENGMEIRSCAEEIDLAPYGVPPGKCIDDALLFALFGLPITGRKDPSQRDVCGCVKSRDIGFYDTCKHGCRYCYATNAVNQSLKAGDHNPESPSLVGWHDAPPPKPKRRKQLGFNFG